VAGPIRLRALNLDGDGQADLRVHGGPDQAVLCYSADHYPAWRQELSLPELPHGGFGENFTIAGQDEATVCIGDVYQVGGSRVQVSAPRAPCYKTSWRWRLPDLEQRIETSGRHGWYLRVLQEGTAQAGQPVRLLERPYPEWSVARASAAIRFRKRDPELAAELARCAALGDRQRRKLLAAAAAR
jgi:MOSC domain-containing protein YiiM